MQGDSPIPYSALRSLFEVLDDAAKSGKKCDHTYRLTSGFIEERALPLDEMLIWLGENGARCDCEVMLNTAQHWEKKVGYQSWTKRPKQARQRIGIRPTANCANRNVDTRMGKLD